MKVAFISQPWNRANPPAEAGSVAIWNYQVTRRLARSCDVMVYGKKCDAEKDTEFSESVEYRYVSTSLDHRVQRRLRLLSRLTGSRYRYFSSWLYYFLYIVKISLDLRKTDCDIVHIQNLSQFVPVVRALNPRIKIVLHMHCEWLSQLHRRTIWRRIKKADLVLGCSEHVTNGIRRRFPRIAERCRTVYNGVAVDQRCPKVAGRDAKAPRLLFVGRVSSDKGLHVLVDALKTVARHHRRVKLDIVGPSAVPPVDSIFKLSDDPKVIELIALGKSGYEEYLKDHIAPSLAESVTFSGAVAHSELVERYATADLYVQPSFTETFGVPVAEAMAVGLPVVGTRVGGIPEIIADGETGLLVESGDAEALAGAILKLLDDDDLRHAMGQAGRRRAAKLFSWEQITKKLLELYDSATQRYEDPVLENSSASILSENVRPRRCQVQ